MNVTLLSYKGIMERLSLQAHQVLRMELAI